MSARPESEFPPSGCYWCGLDAYSHWSRWHSDCHTATGNGWHAYTHPTDEQIKTRMLDRRAGEKGPHRSPWANPANAMRWTPPADGENRVIL